MNKKRLTLVSAMAFCHLSLCVAEKVPVFLYAGQSNADGREQVQNLPDYMKQGTPPYSPYTHLKWASICGNPSASTFGTRTMATDERYAFCDVANYWIDQSATTDFYAIKCAYGGTAIAPNVTAAKLPVWYADADWMASHHAYKGDDITQPEFANYNSLTKNLTEGFASLVDGTLAAIDAGYDVKAILWHQGESDRNASASYYTNFKTMIAYMRQAIYAKTGDEADLTLPFIYGTVCRRSKQYNADVETAQKQVAAEDPNCHVIDMKNATLLDDNLHFDRQATEYLGKKMYNQLVALGLVAGEEVEVEEFPVKESVMDGVVVPTPDNRSWNFSSFTQTTKDALAADVALTEGAKWNYNDGWGYRRNSPIEEEQLAANNVVINETEGLYFTSKKENRVTLNTSSGFLGLVDSAPTLYIPKLSAGQTIEVTARANKNTIDLKPGADMEGLVEVVGNATVGTSYEKVTFRVRYNVTVPTHIGISVTGGAYIRKIEVKTPETVNILIGADQKETFACDKPLDFSPFTDLFKAYVVTGYDDATGKLDCEQVLQVPANTGVLLVGEESTVNVPVIEGDAPDAPAVNLLTAVVGEGSAPAGSYVLTTSAGVTQFTKAANAVALNNEAYLASLGSLDAYGFNLMEAKTEHVYDIAGGSILAKNTTLVFTDAEHHTMTNGTKVYAPANAIGLDGRFAFDNSGDWKTDDKNGSLGQTHQHIRYMSVVELEKGDRVKFETTSNAILTTVNAVLRGLSAGDVLTSGTTYVVEAPDGETVHLDIILTGSGNRNGINIMTVWTATETKPIYAVSKPTAAVELQQVREGLYKPVATLSATNQTDAPITYYYIGGDAADWTALEGSVFEPSEKDEYRVKATAPGYADSETLTLALGHRYALTKTVVDLTDEAVFTASTKDTDGFDWKDANYVKITGLSESQVFGHITSDTAITGIAVQDNKLDARYSFAKGVGLANNYGYWVKTTSATAYDFAEYEVYQPNASITAETLKVLVYAPNDTPYTFAPLKAVRLYEPVNTVCIDIPETGYATYSSSEALDFTGSGVEARYATLDGDNVRFDNIIDTPAASTGLLLKAPQGSYEAIVAQSGTDVSATNLLQACLTDKTVGTEGCEYGKVFILSKRDDKVGFFKSNNGRTLLAGKSYLYVDNPSQAHLQGGYLFGDEATGIVGIADSEPCTKTPAYNLQGQRVANPQRGLYIKNGKKTYIK